MDMPVILIQRILNNLLILQLHAHSEQEKRRHKKRIGPGLFREIIICGNRMLQHMVPKPQRILTLISHLAHRHVPILRIPGRFIQRDQAMPHSARIHRPLRRQPQLHILIHPVFQKLQILLILRNLPRLCDSIISHTARPVPGQVHIHCLMDNPVNNLRYLFPVKIQFQHPCTLLLRISPVLLCK